MNMPREPDRCHTLPIQAVGGKRVSPSIVCLVDHWLGREEREGDRERGEHYRSRFVVEIDSMFILDNIAAPDFPTRAL